MKPIHRRTLILTPAAWLLAPAAQAHGGRAGDVEITHPWALPTPPGAANAGAYLVKLENLGREADRLLRASTPQAQRVELHRLDIDAQGVARMREVDGIPVKPGSPVALQPGGGLHLMLVGVKQPLKVGDTFPLVLEFERGGRVEVKVVVQQPRDRGAPAAHADHAGH